MTANFIDKLTDKLRKYSVPPELIEVELTETDFIADKDMVGKFIEELHANGLAIAMDDFGSGYSSLNMLKDIPIDVLKIDQGFLREDTGQRTPAGNIRGDSSNGIKATDQNSRGRG